MIWKRKQVISFFDIWTNYWIVELLNSTRDLQSQKVTIDWLFEYLTIWNPNFKKFGIQMVKIQIPNLIEKCFLPYNERSFGVQKISVCTEQPQEAQEKKSKMRICRIGLGGAKLGQNLQIQDHHLRKLKIK